MPQKIKTAVRAAALSLILMGAAAGCAAPRADISPTPSAPPESMQATPETGTPAPPQKSSPVVKADAPAAEYRRVSAEEAHGMMSDAQEYILLDVRTDEEFMEQHIAEAVLIPDYEIAARAEDELTDKHALIFVYCRSGRRSAAAAQALVAMGYTNVYDFGGIADWPYATE